jgi:hypothetical protein
MEYDEANQKVKVHGNCKSVCAPHTSTQLAQIVGGVCCILGENEKKKATNIVGDNMAAEMAPFSTSAREDTVVVSVGSKHPV